MDAPRPPSLPRELGLFPTTNIVIANMIGAGIFTTSGLLLADLGSPLLLLVVWLVGGVLALCGALAYGELGAAMPEAGGEYVFLSRLYHPMVGFLSGWVSFFVGFSAPIAASSLGVSEYLALAYPGWFAWGDSGLLKKLLAVVVITAFSLVHLRGINFGAAVQNWLTGLKVALIVGLVGAGLALGHGDLGHFGLGQPPPLDFSGLRTVGLALMWVMFAYSGWNASAYIGSEIRNPQRNLPRSLMLGTGVVLVLYLLINLLFVYAAAPAEMSGVIAVGGLAAGNLFGPGVQRLVSVMVAFALFSSISAFIILGPRVYYAMARDGRFFSLAGRLHPVYRTPAWSILFQWGIAVVLVLSGTFDQILTYMGFSLGIFPLFAVFGLFRLRRRGESRNPMPLYPLAPIVYLLSGVTILALAYLQRPVESSIAVLTVLAGIPAYLVFRRNGRRTTEGEDDV